MFLLTHAESPLLRALASMFAGIDLKTEIAGGTWGAPAYSARYLRTPMAFAAPLGKLSWIDNLAKLIAISLSFVLIVLT